jgi:hypothetical protein
MHDDAMDFELLDTDARLADRIARQQQKLSNLQYIVALLLEKNERMRSQLDALASENRPSSRGNKS